jgi:hypothetical protein
MNRFQAASTVAFGLALTLGATSSAQALTTFASYGADPAAVTNMSWTNSGTSEGTLANAPGDSDSEAGVTDTVFSFLIGGLPTNLAADFDLSATSTSSAAVAFGVLLAQPGISGAFHFTYDGPTTTIDGVHFAHGANLLSGEFDNAFITGIVGGGVASAQAEIITTGPINFTSDFLTFQTPCCGDEAISLAFNSVLPGLHIGADGQLAHFSSSTTGNFSADVLTARGGGGGTPEPATWIMILVGFGGLGAVLRREKRMVPRLRF